VKRSKKHGSKRTRNITEGSRKFLKGLTELFSVASDMVMALFAVLGQEIKQAIWALRIALYALLALLIGLDCGHGKAANISICQVSLCSNWN
jgi:hypothetical protein